MGKAGRKARDDGPSTRMRILEAALSAFAEQGYDGTRVRDISERCGTRPPTIYHFFESKENLFRVTLRSTRLEIMRRLRRTIDRSGSLRDELLSAFQAIHSYHARDPAPIRFIFRLVYSAPVELQERFEIQHAGDFRGLVQGAFRRHGPVADAELKSQIVTHLLQGMLLRLSTPGTRAPGIDEYERMIDVVLG